MTVDDIALTMHPEIGSRTAIHLVECFGSAERLFADPQHDYTRTLLSASKTLPAFAQGERRSLVETRVAS